MKKKEIVRDSGKTVPDSFQNVLRGHGQTGRSRIFTANNVKKITIIEKPDDKSDREDS